MKVRLANEADLVRFAEGTHDLDSKTQAMILRQISSSPELRAEIAEIRKDLYLVDCQIPEYSLSPEYILELNKLAAIWLKMRTERRLRLYKFLLGREFLSIGLVLAGILALALLIISIY